MLFGKSLCAISATLYSEWPLSRVLCSNLHTSVNVGFVDR